jgi:hypothetical protein
MNDDSMLMLDFLQTAKVLGWWVSLVTASQLLNWIVRIAIAG